MADTNTTTRIVEIRTDYKDAIQGISEYMAKIEELKEREKELKKEIKDAGGATDDQREELAAIKAAADQYRKGISTLNKEIKNNIKAESEMEGSLNQLRAELSNTTAAYDALSREERNSEAGEAMRDQINQITDELKKAEEETQRFQRNVGNYKNSIIDAISSGNPFVKQLIQMSGNATTATGAFKNVTNSVKSFGKQLKALMANPIVAVIAAIAAAVMLVKKALESFNNIVHSSEDLTNRWNKVLAPLHRLMTKIQSVLQTLAGYVISVFEGGQKLMLFIGDLLEKLPVIGKHIKEINDANKEAIELAAENADIQKQQRENDEKSAEDRATIARLRAEAQDKENFTAEQRLAKLQEAADLEKDELNRNKELAARRVAELEAESKQSQNSTEMNEKLKQAKIDLYNAETEYYTGTRRLQTQMASARKEIADDEKKASDERIAQIKAEQDARDKQAAAETSDLQTTTDMRLAAIRDQYERETAQENEQFARSVDALKQRLETEADLSETQRAALNEQIELMTQEHEAKLQQILAEAAAEQTAQYEKTLELRLETVRKGSQEELDLQKEILAQELQSQIDSGEYTAEQIELLQKSYNIRLAALDAEYQGNQIAQEKKTLELRLETIQKGSQEELNTRLQLLDVQMQQELSAENLTAEQKTLIEQKYLQDRAVMIAEYNDKEAADQKRHNQEMAALMVSYGKSASSVYSGISDLIQATSDDSEEATKLSKTLAVGQIAIDTGVSIAEAVKTAIQQGFPACIPTLATLLGTIIANMATAITTVKSAELSSGGIVSGAGTGTSDSIPARLSNGESVNTALATAMFAPLYSALNQIGGGAAYSGAGGGEMMGEAMLARAFAKGAAMITPVVSVKEINDTQTRVRAIENLGRV